jgi:parallel beta-helix repeat protein
MDDLAKCPAKFKWMVVDACRNDPTQSAKGIGGKGLQTVPAPPAGIALFQSCAAGEESWEDHDSGNGYFTKNFAAALSGEADTDRDGKLTLMEVCKWTTAQTKEQVMTNRGKSQKPYFSGSFSDFPLTEDLNVPKAKALVAEAEKAMEAENYPLAIEKFDAALALCPRFTEWATRKRDAQRLLENQKPKFDPMKITVPDDCPTIEEAYAKVKDGGIITIKPGKYELSKTLEIDRNVTFRGDTSDPESVVIDCASATAFKITGGSPSFQNLTASSGGTEENNRYGFYITGGTPNLFRCIITSREATGLVVEGKDAAPKVEKCVLKDCGKFGMAINQEGRGDFRDCEIYGNALAGIKVTELGNPTVTGCKIHDGKEGGVYVFQEGLGEFTDCEIYGNALAGICVQESGNPTVTGCKIHDGKAGGVFVNQEGRGEFTDCEIYGNALSGIEVRESGNPTVTGCKIHDGKCYGIYVHDKGMGTFTNNTLSENYLEGNLSNWYIDPTAGKVKGSGNTPEIPKR